MTEDERQLRNDKLNKVINELAESQGIFSDKKKYNDYYMKLRSIYIIPGSANFVHSHNEIFSVLAELDSDNKSLEILGQNVSLLYKHCIKRGEADLSESVFQLYDNINLDIARINYIKAVDRRLDSTGQNLMSEIKLTREEANNVKKNTDELKSTIDEMSGKVNNAYSEFVSILGIFSAIVLVFFGGTSIFGNIISNMGETCIYISMIMCVVTGAVVFNIIFMFIYFLAKILNRSITATYDIVYWKPIAVRFRERYPLIFYINYFSFWIIYVSGAILIWTNKKNNYSDDILKVLKNIVKIENNRSVLVIALLYFLCIFNIAFTIAYIISKITDLNIGRMINVKYRNSYIIIEEEEQCCLMVNYDIDNVKVFKRKFIAQIVSKFLKITSTILVFIYNLFKRVFFRYPYYTFGNIIIMLSIYWAISY